MSRSRIGTAPARPAWIRAGFALIVVGLALRIAWALADRSLWQDELMLALNILSRPLPEVVARPLELNQTAPPLFLGLEWAMSRIAPSELGLRLPSFVAGIALLPAFWWLARRLLPGWAAVVAMLLVTVSPSLVRYSAELKSYGIEALVCTGVVALGYQAVQQPDEPRLRRLLVAGVIACSLTIASPFILAAVWLALAACPSPSLKGRKLGWLVAMGVTWLAIFLPFYFYLYLPVSDDPAMRRFWEGAFLRLDPAAAYLLHRRWTIGTLFGTRDLGIIPGMGGLISILAALGCWTFLRRGGASLALLIGGPIALAYIASLLGAYPIEVRLMLFAAPSLILLVLAGVRILPDVVRAPVGRPLRAVVAGLLIGPGLLALLAGPSAVAWLEEADAVLRDPRFRGAPREPVYVFIKAMPAWIYYTTDWVEPDQARIQRLIDLTESQGPAAGNAPRRGYAVRNEGRTLVVPDSQRRLLIGVPSGSEARFRTTWETVPTDPGWGENEAARLWAQPSPCFWIFFTHHRPNELTAVHNALLARGAWAAHSVQQPGARLIRYCRSAAVRT